MFLIFITLLLGSLNTVIAPLRWKLFTPWLPLAVNRRLLNDGLPPPLPPLPG